VSEVREQEAGAQAVSVCGVGQGRRAFGDAGGALRIVRESGRAGVLRVEELIFCVGTGPCAVDAEQSSCTTGI